MQTKIGFFLLLVWCGCSSPVQQERAEVLDHLKKAENYFDLPKNDLLQHANFVIQHAKNSQTIGKAYHHKGNILMINGHLPQALFCFQKENKIFEFLLHTNDTPDIQKMYANSWASMGIIYSQQSNYTKALNHHFKALRIFEYMANFEMQSAIYNNIAIEYQSLNKFELANGYLFKALKTSNKDVETTVSIYTNIGKNYIRINHFQQGKTYLDLALKQVSNISNDRAKGELYNALGNYYFHQQHFDEARKYLQLATQAFVKIDDVFGLTDTYYFQALLAEKEHNVTLAKSLLAKTIAISEQLNVLDIQAIAHLELAQIYASGNPQQRFFHTQKHYEIALKLAQNNNDKALEYIEMQHQLEEQKLAQVNQKQRRWLYGGVGVLVCLIGLGVLLFYLYYKKQNLQKLDLKLQKDKAELQHKALFLQMNPHFIFNCLGSVSSLILQEEYNLATQYLNKFARLLRLTLENSKEDSITIANEIDNLDQYIALEKLRFDNKFDYDITYSKASILDYKLPSMLLQPLVENAILHGIATIKIKGQIRVDFSTDHEHLKVVIQDNGIGYEVSKWQKAHSVLQHQSMAMGIIKKRIETLGGQLVVEQTHLDPNYPGTTISLYLKLQQS